jgi:hypothetical protein
VGEGFRRLELRIVARSIHEYLESTTLTRHHSCGE